MDEKSEGLDRWLLNFVQQWRHDERYRNTAF